MFSLLRVLEVDFIYVLYTLHIFYLYIKENTHFFDNIFIITGDDKISYAARRTIKN